MKYFLLLIQNAASDGFKNCSEVRDSTNDLSGGLGIVFWPNSSQEISIYWDCWRHFHLRRNHIIKNTMRRFHGAEERAHSHKGQKRSGEST
jgi:hypothetical protein